MDELDQQFSSDQAELDRVQQQSLMRVSTLARNLVEIQSENDLDYEQYLHLQVRIDENRQKILKCNLGLVECIQIFSIDESQLKSSIHVQKEVKDIKNIKQYTKWRQSLQIYKKVLTIREVQLTMILFILEFRSRQNFRDLYIKNFGEIIEFMIPIDQCHNKINNFVLDDLFRKQMEYLEAETFRQWLLLGIEIIVKIIDIIDDEQIEYIQQSFHLLVLINQLHSRWQNLIKNQTIIYLSLSDKLTLQKSFGQIKSNLNVINAAMSIIDRRKYEGNQSLNTKMKIFYQNSIKILKCAVNKNQAKFQAEFMISQGKDELAKQIWNLPENKKFREFVQLCLPSISHSVVYYLPRYYKDYFLKRLASQQADLPEQTIQNFHDYQQKLSIKRSYEQTIRIRINCYKKISFRVKPQNKIKIGNNFFGSVTKLFKGEEKSIKAVIFHIHGGGFISMSSFIHQTYTRVWANNLKVPIVSVDYGKAPDRPFPQGLYDCFEAYMWTIKAFSDYFDAMPQKIILVGDSAGGNLVAALTSLLIKWKLPKPSGLVMVYPALNLNLANYTPSLLTALNDMILPHTFLKICAKSYLGKYQTQANNNQLISPLFSSDKILSLYPVTEIFIGNKDPFHDDCCRFIERLSQLNSNKCHLHVLDEFPHGFLQFDLKLMPNQFSRQATKIVEKTLQKMLK